MAGDDRTVAGMHPSLFGFKPKMRCDTPSPSPSPSQQLPPSTRSRPAEKDDAAAGGDPSMQELEDAAFEALVNKKQHDAKTRKRPAASAQALDDGSDEDGESEVAAPGCKKQRVAKRPAAAGAITTPTACKRPAAATANAGVKTSDLKLFVTVNVSKAELLTSSLKNVRSKWFHAARKAAESRGCDDETWAFR